jgi:hypothetical protein
MTKPPFFSHRDQVALNFTWFSDTGADSGAARSGAEHVEHLNDD